eukprot:CAMPEP_0169357380 /NCGR_PEP_ID=MMETSP1017-20121227/28085_1 /TAXON_ID=342587 /ORGANISM="Karlodinium micrum, Strain CCMP2283" /LENGTH=52 /DNA_ID=CAMNT_0009454311 /DNA_START=239 /DNA_END=394 /DNA_ORIENTATION=-
MVPRHMIQTEKNSVATRTAATLTISSEASVWKTSPTIPMRIKRTETNISKRL